MIRTCLISTALLTTLSGVALAADLPSRQAPPIYVAPIPVFSWTGFYVGGQVGYEFVQDRGIVVAPATAAGVQGGAHLNGAIGGAHVGYNLSTQSLPLLGGLSASGLILGVEGDVDGTDYHEQAAPNGINLQTLARNTFQASARGRLGFAVDRALFYATGGAAFGQFQTTYSSTALFVGRTNSRVGWTLGGGIEYAITPQWSLRAEYRYADFGTFNDSVVNGLVLARRETIQRAQVGFSYKFDAPVAAPIVARY